MAVGITGQQILSERNQAIRRFRSEEQPWVLIGTSFLLGSSLNLFQLPGQPFHIATVVRLSRPWWNLDDGERLIGIGQTHPVKVITLVSQFSTQPRLEKGGLPEQTVEELQERNLIGKQAQADVIMDPRPVLDEDTIATLESMTRGMLGQVPEEQVAPEEAPKRIDDCSFCGWKPGSVFTQYAEQAQGIIEPIMRETQVRFSLGELSDAEAIEEALSRIRQALQLDEVPAEVAGPQHLAERLQAAQEWARHWHTLAAAETPHSLRADSLQGLSTLIRQLALEQLVEDVTQADPILAHLEAAIEETLRRLKATRQPLILVVGGTAWESVTGVATLTALSRVLERVGAEELMVFSVRKHDHVVRVGQDLTGSVNAIETTNPPGAKRLIMEEVNRRRARAGLPPLGGLTREHTVTLAGSVEEDTFLDEVAPLAFHVVVDSHIPAHVPAVSDYSSTVLSSLWAFTDTTEVPLALSTPLEPALQTQFEEALHDARQAQGDGRTLFIPPRPSAILHDLDQQFKAQRLAGSHV
jgi:hypothetical protein